MFPTARSCQLWLLLSPLLPIRFTALPCPLFWGLLSSVLDSRLTLFLESAGREVGLAMQLLASAWASPREAQPFAAALAMGRL